MLSLMYRYGTVIFVGNHIYGFKAIAMIYLVWFYSYYFFIYILSSYLKVVFFMFGQVEAFSTAINKPVGTI